MIIFVKKWNSILIALTFLFVLGALGLVCRSVCVYPVSGVACSGKKIVIDAGHGDPDGGAVGISGVLEKDLNLKIAKYLQAYLEENGAEVMMTRTGDAGLFDSKSGTVREKKRADLQTRVKLMNESDAELLVSVHMNKFTDGRYSGPQVFYAESTDVSKQLAEVIQAELISQLQPPSERTIKPGKDIY